MERCHQCNRVIDDHTDAETWHCYAQVMVRKLKGWEPLYVQPRDWRTH